MSLTRRFQALWEMTNDPPAHTLSGSDWPDSEPAALGLVASLAVEVIQKRVEVSVRGVLPTPWGAGEREWRWRAALATQAARVIREGGPLGFHLFAEYQVEIVFYLTELAYRTCDLDNLEKPVLDTLFKGMRRQAPVDGITGAMFEAYDSRVMEMHSKKARAPVGREGADISITWNYAGEPGLMHMLPNGGVDVDSPPDPVLSFTGHAEK